MGAISTMKPKITIISVTCRKGGLDILAKCLNQQTFREFEHIIVTKSLDVWSRNFKTTYPLIIMWDPKKREGDNNNLHKGWNHAIKQAKGELIVSIVDLTWIPVNCLEKLWFAYQNDTKSCVTGIGHQYKEVINDKPEGLVWNDPRARLDQGTFYQVRPTEMELCVASFPKVGIYEVGGFDEIYDQGWALGEKETMYRMEKAGYKMFIDQTNEYRALYHDKLNLDHEQLYQKNSEIYLKHIQQIIDGERLRINYL